MKKTDAWVAAAAVVACVLTQTAAHASSITLLDSWGDWGGGEFKVIGFSDPGILAPVPTKVLDKRDRENESKCPLSQIFVGFLP